MKGLALSVVVVSLLVGCAGVDYQHQQGTGIGAGLGAIVGAMADHRNPWRGAMLGAAVGSVAGYTVTDISMRGAQEAAVSGKAVSYRSDDGRGYYVAEPLDYNAQTRCRKVKERVWDKGVMVREQVREVCESTRTQAGY